MAIPALATADKSFICSYMIGSDIDHRKALGVINEITTFTNEYIDGFCWIPVNAGALNDQSWFWDAPEKDVVYVKVGVRCSADGYLHAWLTSSQKVSELILWYTNYNTQHYAVDDKTTLHWCIEKMYQVIFGNTTSFVLANIKFQKYVGAGSTRLYLFGSYSNSLTNPLSYTIDHLNNVQLSSVSWYPNNSTTIIGDIIYSYFSHTTTQDCDRSTIYTDLYDVDISKAFLYDSGSYIDYTIEFNNNVPNSVILMPVDEELDDAFYFGYDYKFYKLKLNIGTAGAGIGNLIDWEYWDGTNWVDIPSVIDGTDEFKNSGTNTVDFGWSLNPDPEYADDILKWEKTTINGSELYWIRAKSNYSVGINDYTTSPLLTQGWVMKPDYWLNFSPESFDKNQGDPVFYKYNYDIADSIDIISLCHPTDPYQPCFRNWEQCHPPNGHSSKGIGNNSAREYDLQDDISPVACDEFPCGVSIAIKRLQANIEPNRAWTFVPAHCSLPAYDNQTDCEANGGTWYPDEYTCDSSFTYDSLINYTYDKWITTTPSAIDYSLSEAEFNGALIGDQFLWVGYEIGSYSIFNEITNGDLDELRHHNFTITDPTILIPNNIYTIFTKHVAIGLLTDAAPTLNTKDWIVNWSGADYFSSWSAPDGLASRIPGTPNTPYTRPIIHHDEFNVVANQPCLGGFLYDLATSNAFLERDPGSETKITFPVSRLTDFDFLYDLVTSNAFLERDPGTETKITYPVNHQSDFDFLYDLVTSNAFLERDPGTETKIGYPVGNNADFCFFYKFVQPPFSVLYHLKLTGDDLDDGLSWATAWATWTHAMQTTPSERTLLVEEGNYAGESQVEPDNSIVIFLVKNELDAVSTVVVTLV